MTIRAICDCGLTKVSTTKGHLACEHCDRGCEEKACARCRTYDKAVSRRITA